MADVKGVCPEVLARLRSDGIRALARYFLDYDDRLRKLIEFRLDPRVGPRVDADDILQDSYVEASQRLGEYLAKPSVPLFVWLRYLVDQRVRAVHRQHLGTHKRSVGREANKGGRPQFPSTWQLNQLVCTSTSPGFAAARHELQTRIRKVIDSLDEIDRQILSLPHFEELTNQETAAELAISSAAASKRYIRALRRLRETLKHGSI